MGVYSNPDILNEGVELENPNELLEAYIYDELSCLDDTMKEAFVNSPECEAMIEAGIINKRTVVRLSKNDDLIRRRKMAAYQLAKEKGDPLWDKLVKNRIKERELIAKIVAKYGMKAQKIAKIGQKDYLKTKMPLMFMRPSAVAAARKKMEKEED